MRDKDLPLWVGTVTPSSSFALVNASCFVHFSINWIKSITSPLPASQLELKQQNVLVLG